MAASAGSLLGTQKEAGGGHLCDDPRDREHFILRQQRCCCEWEQKVKGVLSTAQSWGLLAWCCFSDLINHEIQNYCEWWFNKWSEGVGGGGSCCFPQAEGSYLPRSWGKAELWSIISWYGNYYLWLILPVLKSCASLFQRVHLHVCFCYLCVMQIDVRCCWREAGGGACATEVPHDRLKCLEMSWQESNLHKAGGQGVFRVGALGAFRVLVQGWGSPASLPSQHWHSKSSTGTVGTALLRCPSSLRTCQPQLQGSAQDWQLPPRHPLWSARKFFCWQDIFICEKLEKPGKFAGPLVALPPSFKQVHAPLKPVI